MSREVHARFCESGRGRFPPATHLVVVCRNAGQAEKARQRAEAVLSPLGLRLNPDKTRIVDLTRGKEGFDFLGFHLHKVESWKWKGRWYLQRWPSARAMESIRAKVRTGTHRRLVGVDLATVVEHLNPVLRGWGNYFRHGNSARKFAQVDSYVHERLAILTSAKHGRSGRNWASHYNTVWFRRLGVYTLTGTVHYGPVHALPAMNGVGEPCAGEPHARFDRGRLEASVIGSDRQGRES